MSYFKSITQYVTASILNSSTTILQPKGTVWFTVPNTTNATIGAIYSNNGQTFTVLETLAPSGTTLKVSGTGAPSTPPGTLTYVSGTGDASITYSVAGDVSQFTGTSETTLGVAGIQVTLYTNQNCTVYVEQSPNGTNWDIIDSYDYKYQSHPNFGKTIQAVNSYFRVRVQNESFAAVATPFRLQSCLCPIVESLPRSLTKEGNLAVSVMEIEDNLGNEVKISPQGDLRVSQITRIIGSAFVGTTIDPSFWATTNGTGGASNQTGGQFELANAVTSGSYATLQSTRTGRYMNGCSNICRMQVDYGTLGGVVTNVKRWGVFTRSAAIPDEPQDGVAFELINQIPTIATWKAGLATRVSNGSFNGEYGTTLNTIPVGVQTFEIVYTNKEVLFLFNNQLVHKVTTTTTTWTDTLSLPLRAENYNTDTTAVSSLKIRSFVVQRYGYGISRPQWKYQHAAVTASILKRGPGTLQKVVVNTWVNGSVITLYDALSATNPICIITPTSSNDAQQSFVLPYDLDFYTGLTLTTVNAATDVTVVFE